MKAILEFDLSTPEDREDHKTYQKAVTNARALEEVLIYIRNQVKYNNEVGEKERKHLEAIRALIVEYQSD